MKFNSTQLGRTQYYKGIKQCKETFSKCIHYIIFEWNLPNISLSIFNVNNIVWTFNPIKSSFAAVLLFNHKTMKHTLEINIVKFSQFTIKQAAFCILHETLHYVLEHPLTFDPNIYKDKTKWAVACDLIVNDIIKDIISGTELEGILLTNMDIFYPLFGKDIVGMNVHDKPLIDVYNMIHTIPENINHANKDKLILLAESLNQLDNNENIREYLKVTSDPNSKSAMAPNINNDSNNDEAQKHNALISFYKQSDIKINIRKFVKELLQIDISNVPNKTWNNYTWHKIPKSRIGLHKKFGRLPHYQQIHNKTINIHIFLDISTSIPTETVNLFINLISSLPKYEWNIKAHLFNTKVITLDIFNLNHNTILSYGGATDFNCISTYINGLKRYPDNIIVFTDGLSSIDKESIPQDKINRWLWLITEKSIYYDPNNLIGRIKNLKDYQI